MVEELLIIGLVQDSGAGSVALSHRHDEFESVLSFHSSMFQCWILCFSVVEELVNLHNQQRTMEANHVQDDDDDFEFDDIIMYPLIDDDFDTGTEDQKSSGDSGSASAESDADDEEDFVEPAPRPLMTLKQRRHSLLSGRPIPNLNLHIANANKQTTEPKAALPRSARGNWMRALRKIPNIEDPWKQFHLTDLKTEKAVRHRYNALKKRWIKDDVQVKMESEVSGGIFIDDLTHCPHWGVALILKLWFSNSLYKIVTWSIAVKFLSGGCHRTSLMISQCWFR